MFPDNERTVLCFFVFVAAICAFCPLTKAAFPAFEYVGPDEWIRHDLGQVVHTEVGGTVLDIDSDGDIDICSKPWNGNEHIYLRNMLKENASK